MTVFEERQRKEQERVARFGQIRRADFDLVGEASEWSPFATESIAPIDGNSFQIFCVTTYLPFLARIGVKQKRLNQKPSATRLSRAESKAQFL